MTTHFTSAQWIPEEGVVKTETGITVVEHGSDNTVSRPSNASVVYWIGSVEPLNSVLADLWFNTTGLEES